MKGQAVVGGVLVLAGIVLLYLLRNLLVSLIVVVIGFVGIVVAFVLIIVGLGMILWPGRRRRFYLAYVTRLATSVLLK